MSGTQMLARGGWTAWALVPVAALAWHFGPGQQALQQDRAAEIVTAAAALEVEAIRLQDLAYEAHLEAIAARAAAFANEDAERRDAAAAAGEREDAAAGLAENAWAATAAALDEAVALLDAEAGGAAASTPTEAAREIRMARARALVRAGEIGRGANDLEDLLLDLDDSGQGDSPLATAAREELATAYYYGARLLRLGGKPGPEWRKIAALARQNFRYLAEQAAASGADRDRIADHERNTEMVLNLEQSSREELSFLARPRQSPTGTGQGLGREPRPGRRGRGQGDQPARGAGMNGEIGDGW